MSRKRVMPDSDVGESAPVIGSTEGIARLLAEPPDGPVPEDPESRYLLQLVGLHPELQIDLRTDEIDSLTKREKQTLISRIQEMLGIKPLRATPS